MILDGAEADARKLIQDTVYDICIVGSGAVGFAMAQRLQNTGKTVIVLESGKKNKSHGWSPPERPQWWQSPRFVDTSEKIQDLDNGAPVGELGAPFWYKMRPDFFTRSRTRCYGGSTNCWGGFIRPLDEYDFKSWPIEKTELDSYYKRAIKLVGLDHYELFDKADAWKELTFEAVDVLDPGWLDKGGLKSVVIQLQTDTLTTDFQEQFGKIFEQPGNGLTLARNATALSLTDVSHKSDHRISALTCGSITDNEQRGPDFQVTAHKYVLAMGGLEIPRFLLNDNFHQRFNLPDIGKFYMNHPKYSNAAGARLNGWTWWPSVQRFYSRTVPLSKSGDRYTRTSTEVQAFIVPKEDTLATKGISNFRMAMGFNSTNPSIISFDLNFEQVPNEHSRLYLAEGAPSDEKDIFGKPRLRLDWQFTEADANTLNQSTELVKGWLHSLGVVSQWYSMDWQFNADRPYPPTDNWWQPYTGDHHMGTCRMRRKNGNPGEGVVDSNCKVFGFDNLWICSTAVFPKGGWANSTATLLALALRLADQLDVPAAATSSSSVDSRANTRA